MLKVYITSASIQLVSWLQKRGTCLHATNNSVHCPHLPGVFQSNSESCHGCGKQDSLFRITSHSCPFQNCNIPSWVPVFRRAQFGNKYNILESGTKYIHHLEKGDKRTLLCTWFLLMGQRVPFFSKMCDIFSGRRANLTNNSPEHKKNVITYFFNQGAIFWVGDKLCNVDFLWGGTNW